MAMVTKDKVKRALKAAVKSLRQFAYVCPLPARPQPSLIGRPRIGVALGGGFARGLAHVGVLKVLAENRIPIDGMAGTSVGSVVAAAFASGVTVEEMLAEARHVRFRSFARWTVSRLGLATNERMEPMLRRVIRAARFEDLKIRLAVVAADIATGEAVVFSQGDLIPPLRASCSFPGLFLPIEYQGRLLVDGAIVGSVPVEALQRFGVDVVVAVHLKTDGPHHAPANIFQVIGQAFQIAQNQNDATWRKGCDVVIEPDTTEFKWDDFLRADDLIAAGERAARQALPALRRLLEPRASLAVQTAPVR